MNGVHDMGGLQCFGQLQLDDEAQFHGDWEKQVLALTLAMGATGMWNIDESRAARESLPSSYYLRAGYYRIWLAALEKLLLTHELVTQEELNSGVLQIPAREVPRKLKADKVAATLAAGSPYDRIAESQPQFRVGSLVAVRNLHCSTHTRLPAYIRRCKGQITRVHGYHVFPDSHATGEGENPQWLYNVRFDNQELWGPDARAGSVHVDCWEPYLIIREQADS
ncbi:MAG: nitrile hydratase subunit beta [Granulosicoccus sp.]